MKTTTAGLLALVLLSTTGCFQITVPAKEPPKAAVAEDASAGAAPAARESDEGGVEAGRPHEDRAERDGPRDHGWGEAKSEMFDRCMNGGRAGEGDQGAMVRCAVNEETMQDDRLNTVYQEVMGRLDGEERDRLRDHERDWIHERDNRCSRDETGGTNAILEAHMCRIDATIERRVRLERRG